MNLLSGSGLHKNQILIDLQTVFNRDRDRDEFFSSVCFKKGIRLDPQK